MPDREFCQFVEAVRARLAKGAVEYQNRSFSKDPLTLVEELRQEALDLAGWGFILFCRLEAMAGALERSRTFRDDAVACMRATAASCDCGAAQNWLSAIDRAEDASPRAAGDGQPPGRLVGKDRCAP